jgi:phosphopantothenoylcysteine decarboxylase / phosphopantothenate---cysteine ligase
MKRAVVLGIAGGIAAYKAPLLVRLMVSAGIDVHVIMTRAATQFVTPLTLATLSGNRVWDDMWSDPYHPSVEHISLADRVNAAVIAPATANIIGKIASGIADDMLTTVLMAIKCPILICPSMNINMYNNPVVQANLLRLKEFGYQIMDPESGYLACGWTGEGRLPDPEIIYERIEQLLATHDFQGYKVLVTAGPTEEPLDPVRFLTNRSSGKMGVALARRAAARGAQVTMIAGPLKTNPPNGVRHIPVRTAQEMFERVMEVFPQMDVVVKAAAVADFRPSLWEPNKVKKNLFGPSIPLAQTQDILLTLGSMKRKDQIVVGFAAETQDALSNAREKLRRKNADMLVLNDVSLPGAGFDCDTNVVRFLYKSGEDEQMGIMSKESVADEILDRIIKLREDVHSASQ